MRTLTVNEIEEVGGGPAIALAPWVIKGLKWAGVAVAAGFAAQTGANLADKVTGDDCGCCE
jgi:hypothetical protein